MLTPRHLATLVAFTIFFAGCSSNVVLRRDPSTFTGTLGPLMRCEPSEQVCHNASEFDTSRFNQAHTTFFRLPDCAHGYQQILIEDSGAVTAECAAPPPAPRSPEIPKTTEGGGTTAGL